MAWGAIASAMPAIIAGIQSYTAADNAEKLSEKQMAQGHENQKDILAIQNKYQNEQFHQKAELEARIAAIKAKYQHVPLDLDVVGLTRDRLNSVAQTGQLKQGSIRNALQGLLEAYSLGTRG